MNEYPFSVKEIAEASTAPLATVYREIRSRKFNPADCSSVSLWVCGQLMIREGKRSAKKG